MDILLELKAVVSGYDEYPIGTTRAVSPELLRRAADEIEQLRQVAGKADVGPSFREVTKDAKREASHDYFDPRTSF